MRWLAALLPLLAAAGAQAQPAPTRLEIDASGTAQAMPDQLEATLAAQQSGADPASVQQRVNAAMQAAIDAGNSVPGVQARLLGYDMSQDQKRQWTASSRVALRSADSVRLLGLIGRLQSTGLILDGLAWQLSAALREKEQEAATRTALVALVRRANDAATALGLHVDHLAEVRVSEGGGFAPRPLELRALAAAPPAAPAAPLSVDVTASATVLLRP